MDVVVARIGKAHALRGEVTVELRTDEPQARLAPGTRLTTEARRGSGVPRELTVRTARVHNGTWLLAFEEIPDRTGAESLRGTRLLLEHTGFDLRQKRDRDALDRMGPGWRDVVLPRLAEVAADARV